VYRYHRCISWAVHPRRPRHIADHPVKHQVFERRRSPEGDGAICLWREDEPATDQLSQDLPALLWMPPQQAAPVGDATDQVPSNGTAVEHGPLHIEGAELLPDVFVLGLKLTQRFLDRRDTGVVK
jgi:hypothetical protein